MCDCGECWKCEHLAISSHTIHEQITHQVVSNGCIGRLLCTYASCTQRLDTLRRAVISSYIVHTPCNTRSCYPSPLTAYLFQYFYTHNEWQNVGVKGNEPIRVCASYQYRCQEQLLSKPWTAVPKHPINPCWSKPCHEACTAAPIQCNVVEVMVWLTKARSD